MADGSDCIVIDRPVETVFAYVTDVTNDPAWHTDVLEAQKTSEGPIGVGTVWHARFKPTMGISEGDMRVVMFEPNRQQVMTGDVGPMHPTLTYVLQPRGCGVRRTPRFLPDLSTRRRGEHCKNPNAAGQGVWVDARRWGPVV